MGFGADEGGFAGCSTSREIGRVRETAGVW